MEDFDHLLAAQEGGSKQGARMPWPPPWPQAVRQPRGGRAALAADSVFDAWGVLGGLGDGLTGSGDDEEATAGSGSSSNGGDGGDGRCQLRDGKEQGSVDKGNSGNGSSDGEASERDAASCSGDEGALASEASDGRGDGGAAAEDIALDDLAEADFGLDR
jgi:hypothetical protein